MEKRFLPTHISQKLGGLKIQVCVYILTVEPVLVWKGQLFSSMHTNPYVWLYAFHEFTCWHAGTETWPVGVYLQFIGGDKMGEYQSIALPPLAPGQLHDINVDLISPPEPGLYRSQWQICTPNGIISAGKSWFKLSYQYFIPQSNTKCSDHKWICSE